MKDKAKFATVSGQCGNPANPEGLYRKGGFTGSDVWHILRKTDCHASAEIDESFTEVRRKQL